MNSKFEEMSKKLQEFLDSAEGDEYFEKLDRMNKIQEGRYRRFEAYLETHDFDKLIYRLILEHGEQWREKCYHNGCEVYPNNKLQFIIDYVFETFEPISVSQIETMFNTDIRFFRGYFFRIMHGQGSVFDLYNGDDFRHLLSA